MNVDIDTKRPTVLMLKHNQTQYKINGIVLTILSIAYALY